jgi:methionine synthase II (cobalamin-independent)
MLPLLIGSLPISDHGEALKMVFDSTPEIPLWVQLPVYREEGMMVQFSSGIPGITEQEGRVFVDASATSFEDDLMAFYEDYLAVTDGGLPLDGTRFAMNEDSARGFFSFLQAIKNISEQPIALKGQITGPVTLATGLTDQDRRALFYDDRLLDVAVKTLAMKARFQVEKLVQFGIPAIMFIDEPALAGFGSSAFVSISADDIQRVLGEVVEAIHQAGGLAGVHVCANTDWSLILDSEADILSFDAYGFFDRLALYADPLKRFFEQGRIIAWGIVPTSNTEDIDKVTPLSLGEKLKSQIGVLESMGIDPAAIRTQSLITPSCGTGSLPIDYASKVLQMTHSVSKELRPR